ncbi:glycoside hydrolase superfamily [Roridomyces roridus]|uniref:Glycoside hydrolase superfamily n=1 Tax=Roridomyces roridus TaxID=1738132 RepID=A0AAD7FX63_9AGAR|nr:glycoside hydrolase superfamily [Roridomyces roridus]
MQVATYKTSRWIRNREQYHVSSRGVLPDPVPERAVCLSSPFASRHYPASPRSFPFLSPLTCSSLFLAAFHINSDKTIHLNDNAPDDPMFTQMWSELGQMQASGIKVIGMLGGAAAGTYSLLGPDDFDTYYPVLADFITENHMDGMDLDVEQSTPISVIENLITQLKKDFGDDFIVTLAPVASALTEGSNLSGFDYLSLEKTMGSQISWYNAQFYSGFGSIFPDTQYVAIVNFDSGITAKRLVASVLTNPADGDGYIDTDEVVSSVHQLTAMYGSDFGGINGWEYFNALPNVTAPWEWAETMAAAITKGKSG